jgi:NSS family neurotransmitter:Na+ symporter
LAGIVIFAMMGFLANTKGLQIQDLNLASISLAFVSYPMAISTLPLAPLWGTIFFALLIAIGLDSAFAAIEATLPGTVEMSSGGSRKRLGSALCLIGFLGGIFFATRAGLYWLDIVDHWVEKYAMPSIIILECILFAWLAPIDEIGERLKASWQAFPIKAWKFLIRFLIPVLLFLVFGGRVFEEGLTAYQSYPPLVLYIAGWGVFAAVILISGATAIFYNRRAM